MELSYFKSICLCLVIYCCITNNNHLFSHDFVTWVGLGGKILSLLQLQLSGPPRAGGSTPKKVYCSDGCWLPAGISGPGLWDCHSSRQSG